MDATVQYIAALGVAAASAWFLSTAGARALDGTVSAFAQLIGGWRPDPWPRGVQEEDREKRWGDESLPTPATPAATDADRLVVSLRPVRPRTRSR